MEMQKNIAKYLNSKKAKNEHAWEALADNVGIGKTTMTNYSKGKGNPRLDTLEQLCKKLGVTPNMLLLYNSMDEFLLDHVIPTIGFLASLPFDKKVKFIDLAIQMLQVLDPNEEPPDAVPDTEANNKAEWKGFDTKVRKY